MGWRTASTGATVAATGIGGSEFGIGDMSQPVHRDKSHMRAIPSHFWLKGRVAIARILGVRGIGRPSVLPSSTMYSNLRSV